MKTKKKIGSRALAILLAFVMSVSLAIPAMADEVEADENTTAEEINETDTDTTESAFYIVDTETGKTEEISTEDAEEIIDNSDAEDNILGNRYDTDFYTLFPGYTEEKGIEARNYYEGIQSEMETISNTSGIQMYSGTDTDGKALVSSDGSNNYGGGTASGNIFKVGGEYGYCVQPSLLHPTLDRSYDKVYNFGPYTAAGQTDIEQGEYVESLIAKALYYGYGGPEFTASYWPSNNYLGGAMTNNDYYYACHVLVADWFWYDASAALDGTSGAYQQWAKDYLIANIVNGEYTGNYTQTTRYKLEFEAPAPPDGFKVYAVNIGEEDNRQILVGWEMTTGSLTMTKSSTDTTIISGNECYSLAGAEYYVYSDSAKTDHVTTLTTNSDGSANTVELNQGTYYVQEVKASPGYKLDDTTYTVTVRAGEITTFSSKETPVDDPTDLIINKIGSVDSTSIPSLEGAQFQIDFYGGIFTLDEINNGNTRNVVHKTWTIQTKYNSTTGTYNARMNNNCKVSGDDYYYDGSEIVLPLGTIVIKETKAPTDYTLDGSFSCDANGNVLATDGGQMLLYVEDLNSVGTISTGNNYTKVDTLNIWGGVELYKVDRDEMTNQAQGDGTLGGATYTIYSMNDYAVGVNGSNDKTFNKGDAVLTITTDGDGHAKSASNALYYGKYYIKETEPPEGYQLNDSYYDEFEIKENGVIVNLNNDGDVIDPIWENEEDVFKVDAETDLDVPQGDATLAGAEFTIYNISENPVIVDGIEYQPGEAVMVITTDANGYATTGADELPYGTYEIRETKAPTGYLINSNFDAIEIIHSHGEIDISIDEDQVMRGGVGIYKYDAETYEMMDGPQGDAELVKAGFTITNASKEAVYIYDGLDGTRLYEPGEDILFIETEEIEEDGHTYYYASTSKDALPYGTYTITETVAPKGYLIGEPSSYTFTIRSEGDFEIISGGQYDPVIRGGVEIVKRDLETGDAIPQGSATLANAELTIYNESENPVLVNGTLVWPEGQKNADGKTSDGVVVVLYTDEYGYAATDNDTLPYGSYKVVETQAPDGYLPRDQHRASDKDDNENEGVLVREFEIREDGEMIDLTDNDYEYDTTDPDQSSADGSAIYNQVIRGDFAIRKISDSQETMAGVIFQITSNTTGETHYFKTDENGGYSSASEYTYHSYKTNIYDDEDMWDEIATDDHTGLWFYGYGDDVDVEGAPVRDDLGALPYDTYTITEIRTEANEGWTLWSDEFTIGPNSNNVIVDLNNIEDKYPALDTNAVFDDGYTKYGPTSDFTIIVDSVDYQEMVIGQQYTLVAKLYNATTETFIKDENGDDLVAMTVFTPRLTYGTANTQIIFDSTGLEGCSIVVYEYVYEGTDIDDTTTWYTCETDPTEANQTVYFPDVGTTADDSETGTHMAYADEDITIVDTVEYSNLRIGRTYTVTGTLMDKETGEPVLDDEGNEITAETSFMAKETSGTVEVTFTFSGRHLAGTTTVVYEDIYYNGQLYAAHEDLEDEGQTVYLPGVHTEAWDDMTEDHVSYSDGIVDLYDTISYSSLQPGIEYTVYSILLDAETHEPELTADGEIIDASFTFTPDEPDGEVTAEFNFDATGMEGHRTIFYEVLYMQDEEGVDHLAAIEQEEDAEDETVYFPAIHTTAITEETGIGLTYADEEVTIIDSVAYDHLQAGYEYTLIGTLMDQGTGNALLDSDGMMVTSEVTFVPEEESGVIDVEFTFDASLLAGTTTVVFEEMFHNDVSVAVHADIDDIGQSVYIPAIGTTALDSETSDHIAYADDDITLFDTVEYASLRPGETYTITGTLMDKETGEPMLDDNGEEITSSIEFTPDEPDGMVTVGFNFSGVTLAGKTAVVFEEVLYEDIEVAVHADIEDEGQTILFPEVHTTAIDSETEEHIAMSGEDMLIIDTVEYSNIIPDYTYTITGILADRDTGHELTTEDGSIISAEVEFTPIEESGTIEVQFIFDGTQFEGATVVVFEGLFLDGVTVATHTDLTDEGQTVYVPEIGTTATDEENGEHFSMASEDITIVDTVEYKDLKPGEEYTVIGILMDQETGQELLDDNNHMITAQTEFMPETSDGTVEVVFTFPGVSLAGKTTVVYEELFYQDMAVAVHSDIEDEGQTVYIPDVGTTALDSETEDHISLADEEITIVDTVAYTGLKVGETYTVTGTLMDKETGEALKDDSGNEITAETEFFAERSDGEVDVEFTFSGVSLAGKSVVAYEDLWYEDANIAVHADIEDEGQTVYVPDIHTMAKNKDTGEQSVDASGSATVVDTVEYTNLIPGVEYTMRGELMNAETGDALGITGETVFTPEEPDGEVEVEFTFDASSYGDMLIVVFEYCDLNGNTVGQHTDLEDTDQMIEVGNPPTTIAATTGNVKTGDIIMWCAIGVVVIAGAAVTSVTISRKRKQNANG